MAHAYDKQAVISALSPSMERELPTVCNECGSADIIEDWKQGNSVCRGCGLVVVDQLVDLGSEWRTFDDDGGADPNRVGGPANPLLESGLGTGIGSGGKGGGKFHAGLSRAQNRNAISNNDKVMLDVIGRIEGMCGRLSLPGRVSKRAKELFKRYQDHLTLRKDGSGTRKRSLRTDEIQEIIAASVFVACRNENTARTYKEIVALTTVAKKDIGAMVKKMEMVLEGARSTRMRGTEDYITRFCNHLGLPRSVTNTCNEVASAAREQENVYGKTYTTIAAATIYVVTYLSDVEHARTPKQIAEVTGVAEGTIRSTYRLMHPYLEKIIPNTFTSRVPISSLKIG